MYIGATLTIWVWESPTNDLWACAGDCSCNYLVTYRKGENSLRHHVKIFPLCGLEIKFVLASLKIHATLCFALRPHALCVLKQMFRVYSLDRNNKVNYMQTCGELNAGMGNNITRFQCWNGTLAFPNTIRLHHAGVSWSLRVSFVSNNCKSLASLIY